MISLGDNQFFIKADKYNWILIEKSLGKRTDITIFQIKNNYQGL